MEGLIKKLAGISLKYRTIDGITPQQQDILKRYNTDSSSTKRLTADEVEILLNLAKSYPTIFDNNEVEKIHKQLVTLNLERGRPTTPLHRGGKRNTKHRSRTHKKRHAKKKSTRRM